MSKQEEIKQALLAATPGPWEVVNLGDLHIAKGYRKEGSQHVAQWIAEMYFETDQEEDQAFNDAHLIAKAPEYIAYLLEENERLRKELEEKDAALAVWARKEIEWNEDTESLRDLLHKISDAEWEESMDNQFNDMYTTRTINPIQVANEALDILGQEGEGNQ